MSRDAEAPVVCLAGPTAAGKTAAAMAIARRHDADVDQVVRHGGQFAG